jgi:hypothetical protein
MTKSMLAEARLGLYKAETPLEREQALQKTLDARIEQLKASMEGQRQRNLRSYALPGTTADRERRREWSETERQVAEVKRQRDLSVQREGQLRAKSAEAEMSGKIAAPGTAAPRLRTGQVAGKGRPGVETYRPDAATGQRGYMTGMLGVNARGTTVRPVDVNANGRQETVIYVDVNSKLVDTDGRTRAETTRTNRRAAQAAFAQ